jgi:hypothetical protein
MSVVMWFVACSGSDTTDDTNGVLDDTLTDTDTTVTFDTDTTPPGPDIGANGALTLSPEMATLVSATWDQVIASDETWLSWEIDNVTYTTPTVAREVGPATQTILGTPSDTTLDVVLHAMVDGDEEIWFVDSIKTGFLPFDLWEPTMVTNDPLLRRPERYLLAGVEVGNDWFFGPWYTVILDSETGRIVWYRKTTENRLSWQPQVSDRGGYILVDQSVNYQYGEAPELLRTTLDLEQQEVVTLPDWFITYDELDDGTILYDEGNNGFEFHLAQITPDGTYTRLWSCFPWMSLWTDNFWDCAPNTVRWDRTRNTILWSMFQTSTVVELDMSGVMLNEYGEYPGGYAFDPPASGFELQHFPGFTADGTFIASTHSLDKTQQWAREYEVDEITSTLHQVWSYQTQHYAEYAGQAQKLPSGNVLWQTGTAGVILEVTPDGTVVWEGGWEGQLIGNVTPIADLYALTTGWPE